MKLNKQFFKNILFKFIDNSKIEDSSSSTIPNSNKEYYENFNAYSSCNWLDFKSMIKKYGFKKGLSYKFINISYHTKYKEEAILYYHKEKGLILWATSFFGTSLNGGTVYGQVKINEENESDVGKALDCSHDSFGYYDKETRSSTLKDAVYFDIDVRDGMISKLNIIESVADFQSIWTTKNKSMKPFVYLSDFTERQKNKHFNCADSTIDKLNRSCKEVKDIVGIEDYIAREIYFKEKHNNEGF